MPSTPGFPLFACTRFKACKQFPHSQTSSINFSVLPVGLSVPRFAVNGSTPSPGVFRASLVASGVKANFSWFFCRCSLIESRCLFTTPHRSGHHQENDGYRADGPAHVIPHGHQVEVHFLVDPPTKQLSLDED